MAKRAFLFLLVMVFGLSLSPQYAHAQWTSREDFLDQFESDYWRMRKMEENMMQGMISMDEASEKSYQAWMPKLEKDIASYRAAGNEAEARGWERVKARFEKGHVAVLERQRRGYRVKDPIDELIITDTREIFKHIITGRLPEKRLIDRFCLLLQFKERIRLKEEQLLRKNIYNILPLKLFKL